MLVNLDCPVELIDYKLYESKTDSRIYCSLAFNNLASKKVKGLKINIYCYDQFGDPVGGENNQFECKVEYKEGLRSNRQRAADKKILLSGFHNTRKIEVDILKILYDDNTLWSKGNSESIKIELNKIENKNVLEFVQIRDGADVTYFSKEIDGHWFCICGRLNIKNQFKCMRCDRLKQYVLAEFGDEEAIQRKLNTYIEEQREEEKKKQEKRELESALKKQILINKMKRSLPFIAGGLLVSGVLAWGYATDYTFFVKNQQEMTVADNLLPESEIVIEGILDTSYTSYDASSGPGDFTITYGKEGSVKNKVISNITEPQVIDLDHNGVHEFVVTYSLDLPEAAMPTLNWDEVYEFDMDKEELVLANSKYPDYYKNTYIPALEERSAASSDFTEQQSLSVLMKAAEDWLNGDFIPDISHKEMTKLIEASVLNNPLQIVREDSSFYIHGITQGMKISEAIRILGAPDETFEVNSIVSIWYLDNNMELVAEYGIDTIHYIALGEFNKTVLEQSMNVLGKPMEVGSNEYSYITGDQRLKFHDMPGSGDFRVQLFDSEIP